MEAVREYLFSVTATALCCSVLTMILGKKGTCGTTIKFLCGIVMILSVVGPLLNLKPNNIYGVFDDFSSETKKVTSFGKEMALKEYTDIIKDRTAAYILDKAESLGVELTVEVTLCDEEPLTPNGITIRGDISPYAKKVLSDTITKELGIRAEEQVWTG